jgi:hypothetical protein
MAPTAPLSFEVLARKRDADKGCEKVIVDHPAVEYDRSVCERILIERRYPGLLAGLPRW